MAEMYTALYYLRPDKKMAILETNTVSEDMNVVIDGRITTGPKFFFHEAAFTFLIPLCLLNATGLLGE